MVDEITPTARNFEVLVDNVRDMLASDHARTRLMAASHLALGAQVQLDLVVSDARASGMTWAEIGNTLGCSRQNAQQRWGHPGAVED